MYVWRSPELGRVKVEAREILDASFERETSLCLQKSFTYIRQIDRVVGVDSSCYVGLCFPLSCNGGVPFWWLVWKKVVVTSPCEISSPTPTHPTPNEPIKPHTFNRLSHQHIHQRPSHDVLLLVSHSIGIGQEPRESILGRSVEPKSDSIISHPIGTFQTQPHHRRPRERRRGEKKEGLHWDRVER